ncbi:MAG: DUF1097 domain-containing protein [bacterium]|nr:DUF1097 domain-containing protein [bacterium]
MTIKKFLPVALMIAVSAALYVIIASYFKFSALWAPFISWPLYFIAGAKPSRLHKEVIGLSGGVLAGYLVLQAVGPISGVVGATLGLPVTVFFTALIIVLLELTDWFELAPAYFFAFAGYFAYLFGKFGGNATAFQAMLPFWGLLMLGLAMGYLTAFMRKKILEKEGVYGPAQNTVFDKEK